MFFVVQKVLARLLMICKARRVKGDVAGKEKPGKPRPINKTFKKMREIKTMRRMKKFAAITMLAVVMTVSGSQASAGILMADFVNTNPQTSTNPAKNNQVAQPVNVLKSMILMLEGILMSD
jgi:hypothetical protein